MQFNEPDDSSGVCERHGEIAEIFAAGLLRALARKSSSNCLVLADSSLDLDATQRRDANRQSKGILR